MGIFAQKRSPYDEPNYDVLNTVRRSDPLGWILGDRIDGPGHCNPAVGLTTIRELALKHADKTDLFDGDVVRELTELNQQLAAELDAVRERLEELEAEQANIAGLQRAGFKVSKAMGPKRNLKENS